MSRPVFPRPLVRARAAALLPAVLLPAALLLALSACDATSGREVQFRLELRAAAEGDTPGHFTTATGWTVALTEARAVIGPVYFFENPPFLARRAPPSLRQRFESLLIRPALAHPGNEHFAGGRVRAEFLDQVLFDALATPALDLGILVGDAEPARSYSVTLGLPPDRLRASGDPTRGFPLWAAGVATRGAETVRFAGGVDPADTAGRRRADGLPLDAALEDGGVLTLRLHLRAWFDQAHFDRLPPSGSAEVPREIRPGSQVYAAWAVGARSVRAFDAFWTDRESGD